jgi:hypothetical protein
MPHNSALIAEFRKAKSMTAFTQDFLDNSVVPYQTSDSKNELKTADITNNARAFTLLISCKAERKESARN